MVDVKIGRLVERVCVDVVGCVLEFALTCGIVEEFRVSADPDVGEEVFSGVPLV